MTILRKRRWIIALLVGPVTIFVVAASIFCLDRRPPDVREFSVIRDEWELVVLGRVKAGFGLFGKKTRTESQTEPEKAAKIRHLARRCLELAERYPNTTGELAALYLVACRGAKIETGMRAREMLNARIATADLDQLERAIRYSRVESLGSRDVVQAVAPAILDRVKQSPNHPKAAVLLTRVCSKIGARSETEEPPPHFAEAADLLASRYANDPNIFNFCECLGHGHSSPHWAGQFERHLRTILRANQDRWGRCTASLALAQVVQSSVDRQVEAEKLYEQFLAEFDGQYDYHAQKVEKAYRERARALLTALRFTAIGKPAPEIVGVDLQGQPMKLSEYRGKVVLVSFWATWSFPCMKFIPHERELAIRLEDQPFAIVGVNADTDREAITKAVAEHRIIWRSFRDKRADEEAISDEWNAIFPMLYLIDQDGIVRKRWTGAPPPEVLNRMVDELVDAVQE